MTHRTRNTLILASSLVAATPPFVLWFVLMAKFPPGDVSTDQGFAIAICFLLGAFLAPAVGFVCGFLTANFVFNVTASLLK